MNTPKIRFKGFKDDWEQRKFGELFSRRMERNLGQFDNTRWISVARMYFQDPDRVTSNNIDTRTYVMREGDIAFEGHSNQEYRYGRFVANDIGDGVISELFPIYQHIVPYNNYYWKYAIQIETIMAPKILRCIEISYTSSNKLDEKFFLEESTSVPGIEEQRKIGALLSNLDNLITLHQRKCDETKQLKKFMLQKMFPKNGEKNPEIRFEGFTDDWEQRKLGEVAEYRNGKAHENEIDEDGEYIVVNSKFVSTNAEIRKFSNAQNEPLYENEIAFVLSDVPNGRAIARTFLVDKSGKYTLNQRIAGITPHEDTDPYYLHIRMNRNAYFLKFDDGNKQTNLSIKDVLNYEDMYPSYKEQQKIGSYFGKLDHLITLHQRKCEKLKELKKFMLQNMFV